MTGLQSPQALSEPQASTMKDGKFLNHFGAQDKSLKNMWGIVKDYFHDKREAAVPSEPVPVKALSTADLLKEEKDLVIRLSHSTMLIKLDNKIILADPVFSERASPVQWFGPKRFHPMPLNIEDLPPIDAVVISHNHYDHLDKASIKQLVNKVEHFLVPLKLGATLMEWGVPEENITELDWWQEKEIKGVTFAATPTQHFSGRGLFDGDQTLWASWVMMGSENRVFFSGDSGYFPGFKEIGERYGPFDITMVETGAYNERWQAIHMMPEQSLQAHKDLRGTAMFPIHNSTFDLSLHNWNEPLERIQALAVANQVNLLTPVFGQAVVIDQIDPQQIGSASIWWRDAENESLISQANYATPAISNN